MVAKMQTPCDIVAGKSVLLLAHDYDWHQELLVLAYVRDNFWICLDADWVMHYDVRLPPYPFSSRKLGYVLLDGACSGSRKQHLQDQYSPCRWIRTDASGAPLPSSSHSRWAPVNVFGFRSPSAWKGGKGEVVIGPLLLHGEQEGAQDDDSPRGPGGGELAPALLERLVSVAQNLLREMLPIRPFLVEALSLRSQLMQLLRSCSGHSPLERERRVLRVLDQCWHLLHTAEQGAIMKLTADAIANRVRNLLTSHRGGRFMPPTAPSPSPLQRGEEEGAGGGGGGSYSMAVAQAVSSVSASLLSEASLLWPSSQREVNEVRCALLRKFDQNMGLLEKSGGPHNVDFPEPDITHTFAADVGTRAAVFICVEWETTMFPQLCHCRSLRLWDEALRPLVGALKTSLTGCQEPPGILLRLPDSILCHAHSFWASWPSFGQVSAVCKRFRQLCAQEASWTKTSISLRLTRCRHEHLRAWHVTCDGGQALSSLSHFSAVVLKLAAAAWRPKINVDIFGASLARSDTFLLHRLAPQLFQAHWRVEFACGGDFGNDAFPRSLINSLQWQSQARAGELAGRLYDDSQAPLFRSALVSLPEPGPSDLREGILLEDVCRTARTNWPLPWVRRDEGAPGHELRYGVRYFEVLYDGTAGTDATGELLALGLVGLHRPMPFKSLFDDEASSCEHLWSLTLSSQGGHFNIGEGAFLSAGARATDLEAAGVAGFWHQAPGWRPSSLQPGDAIGLAAMDALPASPAEARSAPTHSFLAFVHNGEVVTACALDRLSGADLPGYARKVDLQVVAIAELPFMENAVLTISGESNCPSPAAILAAVQTED